MDYKLRQSRIEGELASAKRDGYVTTHAANLRYLCGYTGSNGLLLFLSGRRIFFTDGRYTEQAHEEVVGARIVIAKGALWEAAAKVLTKIKKAVIGFEAEHVSVAEAAKLREMLPNRIVLDPMAGLIERHRMVKDADELRVIRDAVKLGAKVYEQTLKAIRPGAREMAVAGQLEFAARTAGAEGMSFETIVAAGKRGALPHGRASSAAIPGRGFVVVDSGVIHGGYCSDMTRTPHVGRATTQERNWYRAVLEAQLAALATVAPGKQAWEIDAAARNVLRKWKLDGYFIHSTGHGVGLEIHEPPRIGKKQVEELQPGMVITIEPGIYLPGKAGIRIEDMVVVTQSGCEVLTPVTKELVEL